MAHHRVTRKGRASPRAWLGILVLPLALSCSSATTPSDTQDVGPPPAGMGAVGGTVVRASGLPVESTDNPSSGTPVAGARVVISTGSRTVKEPSTDAAGKYQAFLAPGSYTVMLRQMDATTFTKDLPATVAVREGQITTLNIRLDTGVR